MSRPSFKVYHHPDCAETAQFLDLLNQFNLQYETFVVGTDISESQYEVLFGSENPCPRVLYCNNQQEERLRYNSRGDEWSHLGSVEMSKEFILRHNEMTSFN
tara:strand:+ start:2879 stop:3184 length:306 start_codon:yes stop_codon:yes gene_type:complete